MDKGLIYTFYIEGHDNPITGMITELTTAGDDIVIHLELDNGEETQVMSSRVIRFTRVENIEKRNLA